MADEAARPRASLEIPETPADPLLQPERHGISAPVPSFPALQCRRPDSTWAIPLDAAILIRDLESFRQAPPVSPELEVNGASRVFERVT